MSVSVKKMSLRGRHLFQEREPLPGPETGLSSNTQKWIVWGDTSADKARDFIWKGHPGGEQEGKGTQENCFAVWLAVLGFMVMGLVSGWSLSNHSNSESFLVAHGCVPRWMIARGILGSQQTRGVSSRPFPNYSGWWWLISSVFLIRISCHKTTHANGYYGAWPGWMVSISVLPLTLWPPDAKNWLIGKGLDVGEDWRQEEKGMTEDEMAGWHHQLNGHEFE